VLELRLVALSRQRSVSIHLHISLLACQLLEPQVRWRSVRLTSCPFPLSPSSLLPGSSFLHRLKDMKSRWSDIMNVGESDFLQAFALPGASGELLLSSELSSSSTRCSFPLPLGFLLSLRRPPSSRTGRRSSSSRDPMGSIDSKIQRPLRRRSSSRQS